MLKYSSAILYQANRCQKYFVFEQSVHESLFQLFICIKTAMPFCCWYMHLFQYSNWFKLWRNHAEKSIWYRYLPISYEYHNLECYLLDSNENEWNKFCHRFFSWVNDLVKAVHSITFMFRSILISVSLQSIETHFPSPKSSGLYKLIKCIALYSSCMLINVTETLSWWKVFADI